MAKELIGHVVSSSRVRLGKPDFCYKFVECECNSSLSCVLAKKEEPATLDIICPYDALLDCPLVRVIVEVEEDRVVQILKVSAKANTMMVSDFLTVIVATALAQKKIKKEIILADFKTFSQIFKRQSLLVKYDEKNYPDSLFANSMFKIFKTMNSGFETTNNPHLPINFCLLFGREKTLRTLSINMEIPVRNAVQSIVKSSFRENMPVLHPEMIGNFFEIPEEQLPEAQAASFIRRETSKIFAVPRIHFTTMGISKDAINSLFEQDFIGENIQGIYRKSDETLMECLNSCFEHQGECPSYTKGIMFMEEIPELSSVKAKTDSKKPKKNTKWCANPYTLYRYVVQKVHVFFDHEEIRVEWDGEKYPLNEKKGMTTRQVYDILFGCNSTERFSALEEVHIHGGGVSERKIAECAKKAVQKWNAREVHIWESTIADVKVADRTNFESCCGKPDPENAATTVKCSANIEPSPICLSKHNFAKAFADFFAKDSWCLTAQMELGRICKNKNQTVAETQWNEEGIATARRSVETHTDALSLLSLPLLHSYTLPNNFFKYKRALWDSRETISPFVWREHQRLFHHE